MTKPNRQHFLIVQQEKQECPVVFCSGPAEAVKQEGEGLYSLLNANEGGISEVGQKRES